MAEKEPGQEGQGESGPGPEHCLWSGEERGTERKLLC